MPVPLALTLLAVALSLVSGMVLPANDPRSLAWNDERIVAAHRHCHCSPSLCEASEAASIVALGGNSPRWVEWDILL